MDEWAIGEATKIIANIDPDQSSKQQSGCEYFFEYLTLFTGYQAPEIDDMEVPVCGCDDYECGSCGTKELAAYSRECNDIAKLLSKPSENLAFASPKEWVERALSKKIKIPWLGWAKDRGLIPDSLAEKQTNTTEEKPIFTTERNTLLTIIAALCDYSAIKYQERGAASQIANLTQEIGAAVTDDTIRKVLAKIPEALETRMK